MLSLLTTLLITFISVISVSICDTSWDSLELKYMCIENSSYVYKKEYNSSLTASPDIKKWPLQNRSNIKIWWRVSIPCTLLNCMQRYCCSFQCTVISKYEV